MAQPNTRKLAPISTRLADTKAFYRIFEILPGAITWFFLLLPVVLSLSAPATVAYFIIAFDLFWVLKSLRMSFGLLRGYLNMRTALTVDWAERVESLNDIDGSIAGLTESLSTRRIRDMAKRRSLIEQLRTLEALAEQRNVLLAPGDIYHVVILAVYNETADIVTPSIDAVASVVYDKKKIIFVLAYEERGGEATKKLARDLSSKYAKTFGHFMAVEHPDGLPGEVAKGKGGNITHAGRELLRFVQSKNIPLGNVIVTTLDADHRPHKHYFNNVTYKYCLDPNRRHKSYQPIPLFLNNIWDVPAPSRIIATSNSFWVIIEATRPHRLRNFASHAQSLQTLVDTDFWSVSTIVEDGHQYWRTYFTYDGDHLVEPIYTPIYQDAVLSTTFYRTLKAQFYQLRRWAYGVSDIPYVVQNSVKNKKIKLSSKIIQIWRLFEGHFSWATAPLILTFVAWLPLYLNRDFKEQVLAHQLPVIASRLMTLAMVGLFITIWISLLTLPPIPQRYRKHRYIYMIAQWVLMPVTAIVFGSFAALNAQTRLLLGKRLDVFNVTDKAVKQNKKKL